MQRNRDYDCAESCLPPLCSQYLEIYNASVSARLVSKLTAYWYVIHCNNTLRLLKFPSTILVDLHYLFWKVELNVVLWWLPWDDLHFEYHGCSSWLQKLWFTPDEIYLQKHIHVNAAQISSFICITWSLKGSDPHPGHCWWLFHGVHPLQQRTKMPSMIEMDPTPLATPNHQ